MDIKEAIQEIENLIDRFAKEMTEDDYLEAVGEMGERATSAYNVRAEEMGLDKSDE